MSEKNVLRIKAHALDLELKGEPEYIEEAYRAIREVLMDRFRESLDARSDVDAIEPERPTEDLPVITPEQLREHKRSEPRHLHLVMCDEVYNKVYLINGEDGIPEGLRKVLDIENISRIYMNRRDQEDFAEFLTFDRVLWRELTSAGRDAVRKGR